MEQAKLAIMAVAYRFVVAALANWLRAEVGKLKSLLRVALAILVGARAMSGLVRAPVVQVHRVGQ